MSLLDSVHAPGQDGPCEPRLQNHGQLDSWFMLHHKQPTPISPAASFTVDLRTILLTFTLTAELRFCP